MISLSLSLSHTLSFWIWSRLTPLPLFVHASHHITLRLSQTPHMTRRDDTRMEFTVYGLYPR